LSLIALLFLSSTAIEAQLTRSDIFSKKDMVWYGLDFSLAKFVGKFDQGANIDPANGFELVNKYMPGWNTLVPLEPQNFELGSTFWKTDVYYDLKQVAKNNKEINPADVMSYNKHQVAKEEVERLLSKYSLGDKKSGLGLVFVVESFDKSAELATYWVCFFDIQTKKVLLIEHCGAKPAGIGIRNYWAGALKRTLKDIRETKFTTWSTS
jgi:hypothetical protein